MMKNIKDIENMRNYAKIQGRLAFDPTVIISSNTQKLFTVFTVAVKKAKGSNDANFIPVIVWEELAEKCGNELEKGQLVTIEGYYQSYRYINKDGMKVNKMQLVARTIEFGIKAQQQRKADQEKEIKQTVPAVATAQPIAPKTAKVSSLRNKAEKLQVV